MHGRTLRPEPGFVDLITVIVSLDRLAHLRGESREIVGRKQSAVRLHVIADTARDWTTIEIVACGHQARRDDCCVCLLTPDVRPERSRGSVRARSACTKMSPTFGTSPPGRKTRFASGHCEKIGARVLMYCTLNSSMRKTVGELDRRFHYFGECLRSELIERHDTGIENGRNCG